MRKKTVLLFLLFLAAGAGLFYLRRDKPAIRPAELIPTPAPISSPSPVKQKWPGVITEPIKEDARTLDLPPPFQTTPEPETGPTPRPTPDERAAGRKQRERLPLGVVLRNRVPVYAQPQGGAVLYDMSTGDFLKVYPDSDGQTRAHVHPGVDIYLAQTSKDIETAGNRFPDKDGWIDKNDLHIFDPERAKEFTETAAPVTLGKDPSFSTVDFYERAFKNPDPVVHRVIGPRLIALLSIHEDYSSAWQRLLRDPDVKIRSVTLAALQDRGVAQSLPIMENLITRLAELTKTKAQGETEAEVLQILTILGKTGHPRVKSALAAFAEAWKDTQSPAINEALSQFL